MWQGENEQHRPLTLEWIRIFAKSFEYMDMVAMHSSTTLNSKCNLLIFVSLFRCFSPRLNCMQQIKRISHQI